MPTSDVQADRIATVRQAITVIDLANPADLAGYLAKSDVRGTLRSDPTVTLRAHLAAVAGDADCDGAVLFAAWRAAQKLLQAVTETPTTMTATDGAYIHLAQFYRGQTVVIHTPGGGRQRGIVHTPLRDFSSHIDRAFMIVRIYGQSHRIRVMDMVAGTYWVAPELPAKRRATAEVIYQLSSTS